MARGVKRPNVSRETLYTEAYTQPRKALGHYAGCMYTKVYTEAYNKRETWDRCMAGYNAGGALDLMAAP